MRIVFIGTVEFSRRALERLVALQAAVVGVCTLQTSTFNADHVDLRDTCDRHGIPCLYSDEVNAADSLTWIRDLQPDVIFCFGWSRLLKQELLKLPPLGVVGFHPAALPANRGRHPMIWALALGLESTASTFFFMDEGPDSGDILSQRKISIAAQDDARSLYDKITLCALEQIEAFLPSLAAGTFSRLKQDHSQANTWRKRSRADGQIDWRMSAKTIHNLVRALAKPYVGAHLMLDGAEVKVWKAFPSDGAPDKLEPGKVIARTDIGFVVKCGEGALCVQLTEPVVSPAVGSYL
jgi:methionyl-tRNA formyltransferase